MSNAECLRLCLALAAGEFAASQAPGYAGAWPVVAVTAVLVALLGYGYAVRGWRYLFLALVGLALFLSASVESERRYRDQPWLREAGRMRREGAVCGPIATAVKGDLSRRLGIGVADGGESVALMRAILLGERGRMPFALRRVFVESGTIHLFAISGLHVMIVANLLAFVMSACLFPRRLAGLAALPFLWGYVLLIGCPPSAVRAALMASLYFLAALGWRQPDPVRSWALTFLGVHLVDPLKLTDVASLLSFAVMLAILLSVEWSQGVLTGWRRGLWVSVATWAAGVPIAAGVFGRITPGGLAANLLLVPVATMVVISGAIGMLTSFVSAELAGHCNGLASLGVRLMVVVADLVSRIPGANLNVPRWGFGQCAAWYAALALGFWLVRARRYRARV